MRESTGSCALLTSPFAGDLAARLGEHLTELLVCVAEFRGEGPTPASTFAFEKKWRRCCGASVGRSSPKR
jgi:hypothetical protein